MSTTMQGGKRSYRAAVRISTRVVPSSWPTPGPILVASDIYEEPDVPGVGFPEESTHPVGTLFRVGRAEVFLEPANRGVRPPEKVGPCIVVEKRGRGGWQEASHGGRSVQEDLRQTLRNHYNDAAPAYSSKLTSAKRYWLLARVCCRPFRTLGICGVSVSRGSRRRALRCRPFRAGCGARPFLAACASLAQKPRLHRPAGFAVRMVKRKVLGGRGAPPNFTAPRGKVWWRSKLYGAPAKFTASRQTLGRASELYGATG